MNFYNLTVVYNLVLTHLVRNSGGLGTSVLNKKGDDHRCRTNTSVNPFY